MRAADRRAEETQEPEGTDATGSSDPADSADAGEETGRRKNAAKRARKLAEKNQMPAVEAVDEPRLERFVDAELVEPAPRGGVLEVFKQPFLLKLVVQRQLAAMYAASLLGLLWSYIKPGMRFLVYYIVFGYILHTHQGTPHFALHLFTGLVFVHFFTETWQASTRSIWSNRQLVKKMRMPREMFPIASLVVAGYHTGPQVLLLVIFCILSGWHLGGLAVLAGLLGLAILITFCLALALFFSAFNVFARDFQNIVATLTQFIHFLVPMMYAFPRVYAAHATHPIAYQIYMANPVAEAVLLMQRFFWAPLTDPSKKLPAHSFPPDLWLRGGIMLAACIGLLIWAQRYFSRVESRFAERM